MELPRAFRDDIVFRKARAIQQAGNAAQAIQDLQAYLTEYDPAWTGPAGSGAARLPMQNPPPAGKHVAMARFRLAEAFHQSGNRGRRPHGTGGFAQNDQRAGNLTLTALTAELATAEGKKLPAEIRWLKVQTYFTQQPITREEQQCRGQPIKPSNRSPRSATPAGSPPPMSSCSPSPMASSTKPSRPAANI